MQWKIVDNLVVTLYSGRWLLDLLWRALHKIMIQICVCVCVCVSRHYVAHLELTELYFNEKIKLENVQSFGVLTLK